MDVEGPGNGIDRLSISDKFRGQFLLVWAHFTWPAKGKPRDLAASLPSVVRLKIRVRSNSAMPAKMVMTIGPEGLVVSAHGSSPCPRYRLGLRCYEAGH